MATIGSLLPNGQQQFVDANGAPLSGGSVYFYVPGSTTPKFTYQNPALTVPNTNPVVLNAAGRAIIWGSGDYREVVVDQYGNTVWDQVTYGFVPPTTSVPTSYTGLDTGPINAMVVALTPTPASMAALVGVPIFVKVAITNTAVTPTLDVGGGPFNVTTVGAGGVAGVNPGSMAAGKWVTLVWDGTQFQFLDRVGTASLAMIQAGTDFISPITSLGLAAGFSASLPFAGGANTANYQKFPNGLIIQWGNFTPGTGFRDLLTLPTSFPNRAHCSIGTSVTGASNVPIVVTMNPNTAAPVTQEQVSLSGWTGAAFALGPGTNMSFICIGI